MFGLRIIGKREMLMWVDKIDTLKAQVQELKLAVEHERLRAEGAINLLLLKTQRAVLTPSDHLTLKQEMDLVERQAEALNLFGDESPDSRDYDKEEKELERLQS